MVLPPVAALIVTVPPVFLVLLSATKFETSLAATVPPVTTRSSPVVRSLMVSDPAPTVKVSSPPPPVNASLSAPPSMLSFPVPPLRTSLPPDPVIISAPEPPVIISTPEPPAKV